MAVFRVNKTRDYTVMSNAHLKERDMSLKAKGLLSLMLSLHDEWDYSVAGLCAICKENQSALKSTLRELKAFGYLTITKLMPNETESGRIEYEYNIFEQPQKQEVENQGVENQPLEIQPIENQRQYNTNQSMYLQSRTNQSSTYESGASPRARFVPPTLEEVKAYCQERQNSVDAQKFIDYYTSNGWQVGKNKMRDWKAAVRTWERNGYDKAQPSGKIGFSSFDTSDFFNAAVQRSMSPRAAMEREAAARMEEAAKNETPLIDDPAYKERIEKLKQELQSQ